MQIYPVMIPVVWWMVVLNFVDCVVVVFFEVFLVVFNEVILMRLHLLGDSCLAEVCRTPRTVATCKGFYVDPFLSVAIAFGRKNAMALRRSGAQAEGKNFES